MGVGWGAAALVAGMAIVVVLGLVLVSLAGRPGPVWLPTAAVLFGLAVVAGTAWLVFAPVTYDGPDGTVTCHSPTTANKQQVGYDGSCQGPAMRRRWVVFAPLGMVGAAGLVALVAPGLRRRKEKPTESGGGSAHGAGATDAAGVDSAEIDPGERRPG